MNGLSPKPYPNKPPISENKLGAAETKGQGHECFGQ